MAEAIRCEVAVIGSGPGGAVTAMTNIDLANKEANE
jgi:pyruvate/2-oxoglutarate dehydrogenase complex dihydrolipoamide dehydrogenase (E3) component